MTTEVIFEGQRFAILAMFFGTLPLASLIQSIVFWSTIWSFPAREQTKVFGSAKITKTDCFQLLVQPPAPWVPHSLLFTWTPWTRWRWSRPAPTCLRTPRTPPTVPTVISPGNLKTDVNIIWFISKLINLDYVFKLWLRLGTSFLSSLLPCYDLSSSSHQSKFSGDFSDPVCSTTGSSSSDFSVTASWLPAIDCFSL